MSIKQQALLYCITLAVFFIIDMIWLGLVAKNFYRKQLGHLLSPNVQWWAAILFYLLFISGLYIFAVRPAVLYGGAFRALYRGAFLGLISYATYDLTNQATIKDWPLVVTVVDLAWGTVLGGGVSALALLISRAL